MKHTLYITTLVVAAVLCGICVPAQATTNTMTFDGTAPADPGYQQWNVMYLPWVEGEYSIDQADYTYTWWFGDETWDGGGTMFGLGDYCVTFAAHPEPAIIVHTNSETFFLSSMVMGKLDGPSASLQVVGNYAAGGSVSVTLSEVVDNAYHTYYFTNTLDGLSAFTNLASLHLISSAGKPVFDDVTLATDEPPIVIPPVYDPPEAVEVFDFDDIALDQGSNTTVYAYLANTIEGGYTMTLDSGNGGFLTNTYNVSINDFTGAILTPWSGGAAVSFTRSDSGLFSARSVALGVALGGEPGTAQWDVLGYIDGGGTVSNRLNMVENMRKVMPLGRAFGNADLTKISFVEPPDSPGQPVIDDLTLETNVIVYTDEMLLKVR